MPGDEPIEIEMLSRNSQLPTQETVLRIYQDTFGSRPPGTGAVLAAERQDGHEPGAPEPANDAPASWEAAATEAADSGDPAGPQAEKSEVSRVEHSKDAEVREVMEEAESTLAAEASEPEEPRTDTASEGLPADNVSQQDPETKGPSEEREQAEFAAAEEETDIEPTVRAHVPQELLDRVQGPVKDAVQERARPEAVSAEPTESGKRMPRKKKKRKRRKR